MVAAVILLAGAKKYDTNLTRSVSSLVGVVGVLGFPSLFIRLMVGVMGLRNI